MSTTDSSRQAKPLYNLFIDEAISLSPRYVLMVVPSRWMVGGMGLSDFRDRMLDSGNIRRLVDYPDASEVFPSVDIKGGVCYFLWDRDEAGPCMSELHRGGHVEGPDVRALNEFDVFVRDSRSLDILRKVLAHDEPSMDDLVSPASPFGLPSNYSGQRVGKQPGPREVLLYAHSGRSGAVPRDDVPRGHALIDSWKVLLPKAGPGNSGGQVIPDIVLSRPQIAEPPSACTHSYVVAGPLSTRSEAESVDSYVRTRFLRFLVSLRKTGQDALRGVYHWVPQQAWDREWTDGKLYAKYDITEAEQAHIAEMIKEMPS